MALNLTKRLDRIERLIRERTVAADAPVYIGPDDEIPEGREAVRIVRLYVDPPQRAEIDLPPLSAEPTSPNLFGADGRRFNRRLEYPDLGVV